MKAKSFVPSIFAAGTVLAGCLFQGDPSDAGSASARISIKAIAGSTALAKTSGTGPELSLADLSGLTFTLTEARAHVGRIKLEDGDDDSCEASPLARKGGDDSTGDDSSSVGGKDDDDSGSCDGNEHSIRGSYVVDLLTGASTPDMGAITLPSGGYTELKLKLEPARDGLPAGDPLLGNTLHLKGTVALPGQAAKPFEVVLKFDEELELSDEDGLKLDPGLVNEILVSLKAGDWLHGLDVRSCLDKSDVAAELGAGSIRITEDSKLGDCLKVENTLKENIKRSFDVDDDGEDHDDHGSDDDGKDSI